jgi:hypothetical protein
MFLSRIGLRMEHLRPSGCLVSISHKPS